MFKKLFLPFIMAIPIALANAQCPTLVWQDEFNGTSLDQTKWSAQIGTGCNEGLCGWGNNELQHYTDKSTNLKVSGGNLIITARKERVQSSQYTSARIRSLGKGDFRYGRMEARMKLPQGNGIVPAFWMLPTDQVYGSWPRSGEIDIMESLGQDPSSVYGHLHYGQASPNNKHTGAKYLLPEGGFDEDFHIFAIEWEPNEIRWYVDGIHYLTKTSADLAPEHWPFDQNFHFILNLAVGGNWPGSPDASTPFPLSMEVDYVRVYSTAIPNISGESQVESNQKGVQYSVPSIPGATYTWTVPNDAVIISGQGTNNIIADWGATTSQIKVTIAQSCGSSEYSKNVFVKPTYKYGFTFENFDDKRNITYLSSSGTYSPAINNISPTGVNTSAKVARYDRNGAELYDVLAYQVVQITDASLYTQRANRFVMDVYTNAPVNTLIYIQLENSSLAANSNFPKGRHSRYQAYTTKQNEWERLEFDLEAILDGAVPSNSVDQMLVLFSSFSNTSDTYYFDNFDSYTAITSLEDTQAPTAPTNLSILSKTDKSVNLSWAPSTDNIGVVAYDIYVNGTLAGSSEATSFSVQGLTASTEYIFRVQARDAAGNLSAFSDSLNVSTNDPVSISLKVEAEDYTSMKGVTVVSCSDIGGGLNVASIDNRDFVEYTVDIPVAGTYRIDFRVASAVSTGKFDFRKERQLVSNITVPNTGGNQVWTTVNTTTDLAAGLQKLRITATASYFSLNWLNFELISSARVGTSEKEENLVDPLSSILVYPVPANSSLTIESVDNIIIEEVTISSITGTHKTLKPKASSVKISTSDLAKGLYLLIIRTVSGIETRKIVID